MAREYGRIKTSIWEPGSDFLERSPLAQHLYFYLVTQGSTSVLGLGDWRPKRMAFKAKGWTVDHIERAGRELTDAHMIVIDEETDEYLIRSFLRHDEVLNNPKLATAVLRQYKECASEKLRSTVVTELQRLRLERPALAVWTHPKVGPEMTYLLGPTVVNSDQSDSQPDSQSDSQSDSQPHTGPNYPATQLPSYPARKALAKPSVSPSKIPKNVIDEQFEKFWMIYPRREKKKGARAKFDTALKRATADEILKGAERYRDDPNRVPAYTAHPTTWLNNDCWGDDPLPSRSEADARKSPTPRKFGTTINTWTPDA